MKKRLLAILLTVCLVVIMAPAALAASTTECTGTCSHQAAIGSTHYDTLQEACNAAKDSDTITLLRDIEFTEANAVKTDGWIDGVRYTGDQSFTFDLNGKTISANEELNDYVFYFRNHGSKTNEITLKNGTVNGGTNLWAVINAGHESEAYPTTLNLGEGLTLNGDSSANDGEDCVAKSRGKSTINALSGSTVSSSNAMYGLQAVSNNSVVNIYDGAVVDMNMDSSNAIAVTGIGIVNIYGGTITSEGWGVMTSSSSTPVFNIKGGNISGNVGAVATCADLHTYPAANPSVTISGGIINGNVSENVYGTPTNTTGGKLAVTGGIFDTDVSNYCAGGFECESNGSGAYVVGEMRVAEIDGTIFSTLQAAFDAAEDGDTIKILCDITITEATAQVADSYYDGVKYTGDKSFTVDFDGHTVTDDGCVNDYLIYVINKGTKANEITFTNGKIVSQNGCWSTVCVNGNSSSMKSVLNLNGMNITNSNGTTYPGNEAVRVREMATVDVNSGTTLTSDNASYGIAAYTQNSTVNINSGATIIQKNSTNPGGNHTCAAVSGLGTINIYDGAVITSDFHGVHPMTSANPVVHIYGGSITGTEAALYSTTNGESYQSTTINVYGGIITGALQTPYTNGYIRVSGGTFSVDPTAYCLDGYKAVSGAESGLYTVQENSEVMVAQISNGVKYTSLQAAIDVAAVGSTVTLLKDVTLTETVTINKTLTLDLNGCTITNATTAPITVDGITKLTTVTVKDSSEGKTGTIVAANTTGENDNKAAILIAANYRGKFVLESGTLQSTKYGIRSTQGTSQIVINGGTIEGAQYGLISFTGTVVLNSGTINSGVWGVAAYGNFTMNGGTINAQAGYVSSGTRDYTVAVINGGTINASIYDGIYWPSAGSLTINGGSITGACGVYVKSGTVAITGGSITATGEKDDYAFEESGSVVTGDALVIENVGGTTGYEAITSVSITGGTFTSVNASAVGSYTAGIDDTVDAITGFISGGTYSDDSAQAYLVDGYALENYVNGEGKTVYGVEPIVPTFSVTYTDGVDDEIIFADQTHTVRVNSATPKFAGTPTRDGYTFIGWTPEVSATVTGNATYTAVWQENNNSGFNYDYWYWVLMMLHSQQFDVTATATEGGVISPVGISKVKYDKNITYTITPDEGYAIADVLVNGESVGAVSEYTIRRIKKDQTIHAIFVKTAWENPYTDVSDEAWYYADIEFVTETGLMIGTGDNMFSPSAIVNRAMLVTVLWRLEGSPVVESPVDFYDIPANEWYTAAVDWASANSIVNGYGDGIFGAMDDLTHEQIMAILNRYAVYKKWSENVSGNADDSYTNSEWAENNVLWADLNGMFDGIGSDISNLTESADRAELAAYLKRFCERFMAE